jgi:hypothetical protein
MVALVLALSRSTQQEQMCEIVRTKAPFSLAYSSHIDSTTFH